MHIRFLASAENEMLEAAAYYEFRVRSLGGNFLDIVEVAVNEIAEDPFLWMEIHPGIRRRLIRRFPYSVLYSIYENEIVIIAVMHHKQRPKYWLGRI